MFIDYRHLIIIICTLLLSACSGDPESPEQQVKESLKAMELAAQERSRSDFMRYVSDDYFDLQGNNKESVKGIVQLLFLRNQKINIFTVVRSIEVNNGVANVEVSAAMASRDVDLSQENNRLKADTQRFSIVMVQKGKSDVWQVRTAEWQRGW